MSGSLTTRNVDGSTFFGGRSETYEANCSQGSQSFVDEELPNREKMNLELAAYFLSMWPLQVHIDGLYANKSPNEACLFHCFLLRGPQYTTGDLSTLDYFDASEFRDGASASDFCYRAYRDYAEHYRKWLNRRRRKLVKCGYEGLPPRIPRHVFSYD